ncbi:MAG: nucleotide exchange factor GrpE [Planctomycetota bacterium]
MTEPNELPQEQDLDVDEAVESDAVDAEPVDEAEALREENRQLFEKLARQQADYQNAQRRLTKDADQRLKVAAGHLMRELLPVVDNLERALDVSDTADVQSVLGGVRGTLSQFLEVLKNNGVAPIEPADGDEFDANRHEALMQEPREDAPEAPVVTKLLQKGYDFDGRVIRPAQVAVSRPG